MNPFRETNQENEQIITPQPPPPSTCCVVPTTLRQFKQWMQCIGWTLCASVMILFAAAGVLHFVFVQSNTKRLHCYECISISGTDVGEPGLPVEARCQTAPKNWRICNEGEVCAIAKVQGGGMTRFHRSCSPYNKKIGCSPIEKNAEFNTEEMYCACDKDYCTK